MNGLRSKENVNLCLANVYEVSHLVNLSGEIEEVLRSEARGQSYSFRDVDAKFFETVYFTRIVGEKLNGCNV
jgi:hypothetical protein